MTRPTFTEGVVMALGLSIAGAAVGSVLEPLADTATVLRLVITTLAGIYGGWLVCRSPERAGRILVPGLWITATGLGWAWLDPLRFLLLQALCLWLVRSLYHHARPLTALLDLALSAAAVAAALWAHGSGSLWLAAWSFFLVQALFPWSACAALPQPAEPETADREFKDARNRASQALTRLTADR